jgi:hypothetical protein
MKLQFFLGSFVALIALSCQGNADDSSEEGVQTLCFCEHNVESSRNSYAFVVKGEECCQSTLSSDYPAVRRSFELRAGNTWELIETDKSKPKRIRSEACDLDIEMRKVTINEGNTEFVNRVLSFGQ